MEGETDVQVLWFRVRGLLTRHRSIDQRAGRRPRLAEVVDHQQRLQRTAEIAIAPCHDLIDGRFAWIGKHCYSSEYSPEKVWRGYLFLCIPWTGQVPYLFDQAVHVVAKLPPAMY